MPLIPLIPGVGMGGGGPAVLVAESGAITITGTAATLLVGREVSAAAGAITITGTAASLEAGRVLSASAGSVAISGTATSLEAGRVLACAAGTVTITGGDASFAYQQVVTPSGQGGNVVGMAAVGGFGEERRPHLPRLVAGLGRPRADAAITIPTAVLIGSETVIVAPSGAIVLPGVLASACQSLSPARVWLPSATIPTWRADRLQYIRQREDAWITGMDDPDLDAMFDPERSVYA